MVSGVSDLVGAGFRAVRGERVEIDGAVQVFKAGKPVGNLVAASDLKRGRGYGMSLNGNAASDGYNGRTMRSREPEWRPRSKVVSIVRG